VGGEALLDGFADLADVDGVGGNAFFFDELLYLHGIRMQQLWSNERPHTRSSVFAARSLTKGRAMTGMRCEAETCPSWLLLSKS
jgi:hypothetical protein